VLRLVLGLTAGLFGLCLAGELYLRAHLAPAPAEVGLRYAQPPLARLRVQITRSMPGLRARQTWFTTNALGVRGDELDLSDHTALRVLALGDSVTEALLLDDDQAWPHQLQGLLAKRLTTPVWVGNAARSGELMVDFVTHVKLLAPVLRPDVIVVMPGGYELQATIEEKLVPIDLDDPAHLRAHAAKLYVPANLEALRPSYLAFMLYGWLRPQTLDMTELYERMRQRRARAVKKDEIPDLDDALDIYQAGLQALVRSARALQPPAKLVLLTSPFLWRADLSMQQQQALWAGYSCMDCTDPEYVSQRALAAGLQRFNRATLALCESERLSCLDLEGMLPKSFDNFYDDAHLTEAGSRIAAEAIANFLAGTGIEKHAQAR
jgi:hypothetical protein